MVGYLCTFYRQSLSLLYSSFFFWNFRHRLGNYLQYIQVYQWGCFEFPCANFRKSLSLCPRGFVASINKKLCFCWERHGSLTQWHQNNNKSKLSSISAWVWPFQFYHSFERKGRSANWKICVLPQFWASDRHEVTRGLSNPQLRSLRPDRKKIFCKTFSDQFD